MQHVLLESPGVCRWVSAMKSSIPVHRRGVAIWRVSAAQHNAHFQRHLRNLGVPHQHYTLHELRGGGATDHWLQYRDLHSCDAGVSGPLKGPLKDTFKKAHFDFIKTGSPKQWQTGSRALAELASFLCRTRLQSLPLAPTATTLQRKGQSSSLRSAQRRRATQLCLHRLASRSVTFAS